MLIARFGNAVNRHNCGAMRPVLAPNNVLMSNEQTSKQKTLVVGFSPLVDPQKPAIVHNTSVRLAMPEALEDLRGMLELRKTEEA